MKIDASDLLDKTIYLISEHLNEIEKQVQSKNFDNAISTHITKYASTLIDIKDNQEKQANDLFKKMSKMDDSEMIKELEKTLADLKGSKNESIPKR